MDLQTDDSWIEGLKQECPEALREAVGIIQSAEGFGSAVHYSGAITFGWRQAFEPGSESWLHTLYPGLPASTLEDLEVDYGLRFSNPDVMNVGLQEATGYPGPIPPVPAQVKRFLGYLNGARLYAGHLNFYGVQTKLGDETMENRQPYSLASENFFRRPMPLQDDLLVIGGYRWDGSHLCANNDSEEIVRFDSSGVDTLNTWPDIWTLVLSECQRLRDRFDAEGVLLRQSVPTVPGVLPY